MTDLSILTMDGKVVGKQSQYKSGAPISIEYLPTGTYILLAQYVDGSSEVGKFVIAR